VAAVSSTNSPPIPHQARKPDPQRRIAAAGASLWRRQFGAPVRVPARAFQPRRNVDALAHEVATTFRWERARQGSGVSPSASACSISRRASFNAPVGSGAPLAAAYALTSGTVFDIPREDVGRVMRLCISGFALFAAGRENAMLVDQVKVRRREANCHNGVTSTRYVNAKARRL
jgi:hypothetical protein